MLGGVRMSDFIKSDDVGHIHISNDVIAVIVGTAALEVPGVYSLYGNLTGEISEMLGRKNFAKGIDVKVEDNEIIINVTITVRFGEVLKDLGKEVQEKVKTAVETMTGLEVKEVNVHVAAVQPEGDLKE